MSEKLISFDSEEVELYGFHCEQLVKKSCQDAWMAASERIRDVFGRDLPNLTIPFAVTGENYPRWINMALLVGGEIEEGYSKSHLVVVWLSVDFVSEPLAKVRDLVGHFDWLDLGEGF